MSEWKEQTIGASRLVLHAGGEPVCWSELQEIDTPDPTDTWTPVPHVRVVEEVKETLGRAGLVTNQEAFGIYKDGARFFGLLGLDLKGGDGAYQVVVGLRNSHDRSFPVGMVVGSRVFVCDNLAFSSEINVVRRHTKNVVRDFPRLIATAVAQIGNSAERQEKRFAHYRNTNISDMQAHDLIVQSMDIDALGAPMVSKVLQEWREPSHQEFQERSLWALWNSYTEAYKALSPQTLPKRTIALQGLMDAYSGFALAS